MVRQRGEGAEPVVNARISANLARLGGMIAVADTRGHRRQSGRSRILACSGLAALSYGQGRTAERRKGGSRDRGPEGSSSA